MSWVDDVDQIWVYLTNLDLLGFITACYTTRIGEFFYGFIMLVVMVAIYLRTESLTYCIIVSLLIGSLGFFVAAPSISTIATILIVLGLIGLFYKIIFEK